MTAENEQPQIPPHPGGLPIQTGTPATPPPSPPSPSCAAEQQQQTVWVTPDYSYYSFYSTKEFSLFCSANKNDMFPLPAQEGGEASCIGLLRKKLDFFLKSHENTKGGCGCNRAKRVEQSVKTYCSFLEILNKCSEGQVHIKSLLNSVEKIHFWKDGQRYRHQGREGDPKFVSAEAPFMII